MYPTIYHAVKDLFGIEINGLKLLQSFGFFVAVAFLVAAYVIVKEMKRYTALGIFKPTTRKITIGAPAGIAELAGSFVIGFLLGWKIIGMFFTENVGDDPRAFVLSGQGSIAGGVITGIALAAWRWYSANKNKLPKPEEKEEKVQPADHVGNIILYGAAFGFLGAKLFHIFENFGSFLKDPWGMFASFSGLTMYGGLIMGGGAVIWYARKHKFGMLQLADVCSPAVMLAYGVGRMGCHISGDGDWGIENTTNIPGFLPQWFWAYTFPNNVNGEGHTPVPGCTDGYCVQLDAPVYPTSLYEFLAGIFLFFVLWSMRKKITTPGLLFSIFLLLNGAERFLVELIRVNVVMFHIGSFGVTQAEIIAFCLLLVGGLGIWWTKFRRKPTLS